MLFEVSFVRKVFSEIDTEDVRMHSDFDLHSFGIHSRVVVPDD